MDYKDFTSDKEKMRDFYELSKEEFLKSYSYLTEKEYDLTKRKTEKKLTFHFDAGHAWLEVDAAELERLGVADKISKYSYRRGGRAYLEEDCDAGVYITAAAKAGQFVDRGGIREIDDGDNSYIRGFARYYR